MLMSATRTMILIFVPLAFMVILLRFSIITGLYGSAKFDANSVSITAGPLAIYAITMLAAALEIIVNQFYFAMSDTIRPTVVGMVLVPVQIGIAYFGAVTLNWGAVAIALGLLVYRYSKVIVLYTMIRGKLGALEGQNTLRLLGKIVVALLPLIAILVVGNHLLLRHTAKNPAATQQLVITGTAGHPAAVEHAPQPMMTAGGPRRHPRCQAHEQSEQKAAN